MGRNLACQISDELLAASASQQAPFPGNGMVLLGFKTYSSFREESHTIFYAARRKLTMGEKTYDAIKLAQDLLAMRNVQQVVGRP